MRKLYTLLTAIIITSSAFAQAPEKMSYQAVVRDGSDALVSSTSVGMQISILQGTSSGTAIYVETQTPMSNANGLVSIEIGGGTLVSGAFSTIDWANGPYFVKMETDPTGGTTYTITGTSQLLSVPFALHAKNTDSWSVNGDSTFTFNNVGIGSSSPSSALTIDGTSPELTIQSIGSGFHHGAIVMKARGINNKRALGMFMFEEVGANEWFFGRPYGSSLGGSSDQFVIQRLSTNSHNIVTSGVANGANTPTGTERLLTLSNSGHLGLGTNYPLAKVHVKGGDVYLEDIGTGVIMKSPNGSCWRVTVDNTGNFTSTAITCP